MAFQKNPPNKAKAKPTRRAVLAAGLALTLAAAGSSATSVTDTSYTADGSSINISTVVTGSGDSTVTYYVADVVLDDATTLKSAFANDSALDGAAKLGTVTAGEYTQGRGPGGR